MDKLGSYRPIVWFCLFPVKPDAGLPKDGPTLYRTCRRAKPGTLIGCAVVKTPDLVAAEFARYFMRQFAAVSQCLARL